MQKRPLWRDEAWVPLIAGLAWIGSASDSGWLAYALAAVPGSILIASGVTSGLWPGDPRAHQHGAMAGLLGVLLGVVAMSWAGLWGGLGLMALSAAAFVATGFLALRAAVPVEGVPEPTPSLRLAAEVAADEAILWMIVSTASRPERRPHGAEIEEALAFFRERGWLEKPSDYYATPPALDEVRSVRRRFRGTEYEALSFRSGYEPHADEPGRERYLGYLPLRTAHAWCLRQTRPERPWILCIHGLGMGWPLADFTAFPPSTFHQRFGLNVLYPILPFHGPRRISTVSGEGFFSRNALDTLHAAAQIVWDLRRWVSWIRSQGGERIGVYGLSLGGFSTAMLASFEEELACAIPGIPAADFAALIEHHTPALVMREIEAAGLSREQLQTLLGMATPLSLTPKVPHERRYLFGGTADRIVPPDPVHRLWLHWDRPRMVWSEASHMSAILHRDVKDLLREALTESQLLD